MPKRIGPYQIIHQIGEGGLSKVFLAKKGEQLFAVKVLKPERVSEPQAIGDFVREARIGSKLDHPNILRVIDHGRIGETYFLVTELLLGASVAQLMADWEKSEQRVPLPFVLYLLKESCRALRYIHQKSIFEYAQSTLFHGDVAPDNFMVTQDGTIRLMDFGSAGQESLSDTARTHFGKISYLPPEIFSGHSASKSTDLYSLAVMAYHLFSGRKPFHAGNRIDLIEQIQKKSPPRLECQNLVKTPSDENALRIFFNQAMHKNSKMRFGNIDELETHLFRIRFTQAPLGEVIEVHRYFHEHFSKRLQELDRTWSAALKQHQAKGPTPENRSEETPNVESLLALSDRRSHPRIPVDDPNVSVEVVDVFHRVKLSMQVGEIGRGGFFLKWESLPPRRNADYPVILHLGKDSSPIKATAQLNYEVKRGGTSHAGFKFTNIGLSDIARLDVYVAEKLQSMGVTEEKLPEKPQVNFLDLYFSHSRDFLAELRTNIRQGRMLVQSKRSLDSAETVIVRIHLPHTMLRILLKGTVVLCQPTGEETFQVGLEISLDPSTLTSLERAEELCST